jgi:predicted nucleic acid-binding Zn ribbon protein
VEPVSGIVAKVVRDLGLEDRVLGWRAVDDWANVVGPRIASHSRAVAFREGTLHVEVEGSAWMQELAYLKREMVRRLNQALERELVHELRFSVGRGGNLR